ncbi:hypothetical protein A2697_02140 [Candidatus Curtissbacteria bacterium RIFCSPHIGHO2_01_FULL_41_44]|uniref:Uncharacterized protein n=1 Tax=Candidatus Curtissbacteria bacterium RIFCSPLOWO2_01_FULL_42_50 TaxID=1797730 RepID=A0A1F5H3N2_9BACT|nr:MAG: hypothetical protein A2697_02140 [Candidatus Curtissbacteria bacterium RIFCSPHIGHO2_01_FULL_41_44]OGD94659.1 MAG: hypothetical protein A3C33_01290 [Candidatus Curtissbacteria bacterium RIFCSPHIGHO2_02_FULL_42_58]OGD96855.1 MAG: hypothetical protein A3E71_03080 [Candidatus Curtissbacteria bacterium RIFCSPHIGHO2_12_FULL_42_33]OGD98743.1 MAG: hypothetical protein A3B54_04850 [Candidatus Curtissbacteria bacterium RIFCSPLOWO2_01_FULL_42_50]OGE02244.1 MAG: hypothetical protein A3G16_01155 [Ca
MMGVTVLQELPFTKRGLSEKLRAIKIDQNMTHHPNNPHTNDIEWNWCKDEFAPPLSHDGLQTYVKDPAKFRRDLLFNLRLYLEFCSELGSQIPKTEKLPPDKRLSSLLALSFLFMSAMDNHYYHYDYYLDLEEYPKSPLGWHYLRMKKIVTKVADNIDKDTGWAEETLLHLLSKKGPILSND